MNPLATAMIAFAIAFLGHPLIASAQPTSEVSPASPSPLEAGATRSVSAEALTLRARELGLAWSLPWLRVMHYRAYEQGYESEVDDAGFFLASDGKTSPQAELDATIRAFLAPATDAPDHHARCRFPARFALLDESLGLRPHVPEVECPKLDAFVDGLAVDAVGLVYVGTSLKHPASAMGHTFVVVGPREDFGRAIDGKHGVEFLAKTATSSNPISYVADGFTGGFVGYFRVKPFAKKLHEYGTEDNRDAWQYELDLTPSEAQRVALHLWELVHADIDYYYLSENCSYHALTLIEGAVPRLDLTSGAKDFVIPLDTIKAIPAAAIRSVHFFPSKRREKLEGITPGTPAGDDHPRRGHSPMRVRYGVGISESSGAFATWGFRLAIHDLVDPRRGHDDLVQVQVFDVVFRADLSDAQAHLDEATFVDIFTVRPINAHEQALSWRIRALATQVHDAGCPDEQCFAHGLNAGLGGALATGDRTLTLFVLAEGWATVGTELEGVDQGPFRLGVGPAGGLRIRLGDVMTMLSGRVTALPGQTPGAIYDVTGQLRVPLATDVAVGVDSRLSPQEIDGAVSGFVYF